MTNYVEFWKFEEARIAAGLFFTDALQELDISERTLYRWKKADRVPYMAHRIMELLSGDLSRYGWNHWELRNGVLYNNDLNNRYYSWLPGELLISVFCDCPAHREAKRSRRREKPAPSPSRSLPLFAYSDRSHAEMAKRSGT